jgi:hypothetical protein
MRRWSVTDRMDSEALTAGGELHGVADDRDLILAAGVTLPDLVVEPRGRDPATGVDLATPNVDPTRSPHERAYRSFLDATASSNRDFTASPNRQPPKLELQLPYNPLSIDQSTERMAAQP